MPAKQKRETAIGITEGDARSLDQQIDDKIRGVSEQLALAYLEVAAALKKMRDSKGYTYLGHATWEKYLESKKEFGRSYLSYLYKLGQAGDLKGHLEEKGIPGTKLIEYVKRTDYPEKLPQLIEATWEEVKDVPVRQMGVQLNKYIEKHAKEYKKPKSGKTGGRPKLTMAEKLDKQYRSLSGKEKKDFLAQVQQFLEAKRS